MRLRLLSLIVLFISACCCLCVAQPTTPADYGLKAFTIKHKSLGTVHFYVSEKGIDRKKPVLFVLDGSGHYPLAMFVVLKKSSFVVNSFDTDLLRLADKFHVVMISKPGVPFCDTVKIDKDSASSAEAAQLLPSSPEYRKRLGLQWRAEAASSVLDYVYKHLPVDKSKVIAYGYSEGAQVTPKLAILNKKITHCVSIFGSGLNQLYDFVIDVRMKAAEGIFTPEEAQRRVDSLFMRFAAIYAAPHETAIDWEGHSYQRWASFGSDVPLDNLVKLNIPVFMAAASADHNSPILGLEYTRLEFLRLGKKNLSFHVYPTDHFFNELKIIDGRQTVVSHKQHMLEDLMQWIGLPGTK